MYIYIYIFFYFIYTYILYAYINEYFHECTQLYYIYINTHTYLYITNALVDTLLWTNVHVYSR